MMESPVRICIGAALVVNLLLLCSAPAHGFALPAEVSTTPKDDSPKHNFTRTIKPRKAPEIKTPDVSLNELSPKGSTSEEHTEKNAKYKDRGRVRFGAQRRSTTETPIEKSSSETLSLIIVTPTPEVKKPAQIIDSMRSYKKTKLPTLISSTTPISKRSTSQSSEEYEDKSGEESEESYEKFTSRNFHNSYFTAPNFEAFDFSQDTENQDRNKYDYNTSPYSFSAGFPQDSFTYKEDKDPFKSSFFDFETELTTPKNDFFDSRYKKVSSSIINRIQAMKAKAAQRNATNQNSTNEHVDLGKLSNNTPSHNISSVFIKNTKEIRLKDNEGAGSANKELSDVQGTSVYYEMSVLSTETYTINHSNEDDCDTEPTSDPAVSSSSETTGSLKATQPTIEATTKPSLPDEFDEIIASPTFFPFSTANPILNVVPLSTQNSLSSITERQSRISGFRNRSYSKRLNTNGVKDSLNNVTPKTEVSTARTRKFHQTTRIKPVWMSPRNNVTRIRSSTPKTIYSEHFDIKDRFSTPKSKPTRTVLTTVSSSEIDPILQTEVSGVKKVVQSQTVKQNSIPTLRKRGSMKYGTSTASSAELEAELSELEMPSTAWALAKLISPPPLPSPAANEVQKVGEEKDKKEITMASTSTTTPVPISNEIITKKDTEYDQNKLQMQPVYAPTSPILDRQVEAKTEKTVKENITKESNLASQPPATVTTESPKDNIIDAQVTKEVKPLWIPNAIENETTSAKSVLDKTIPPIDATRSTGFESITKLPADVTTPQDEVVAGSELNQTVAEETPITTTDYEITTIRFSYVPTDQTEDSFDDAETTTQTVQKAPTRTKLTSETDEPITTYRPRYITTETIESTTILPDTTPVLEVSSQVEDETTKLDTPTVTEAITTEDIPTTTEKVVAETMTTEAATTTEESTKGIDLVTTTQPVLTTVITTTESTTTQHEETTTTTNKEYSTIIEVRTEINTEISTSFKQEPTTETSQSEENSNSNEIIYEPKTESTTMTPEVSSPKKVLITSSVIELDTTVPDTTTVTETSKIIESTTDDGDKGLEDDKYGDMTTEASSRVLPEEAGSGAAIAIAVSTIGVIALILLIGLLVVVRRRGRRGVYAQRCTPVSLDAYSLDSVSVGHRKGNQRLRASKRSYGNPAYDDEVTSHPMQYPALANFALDIDSMTTEFSEIPTVTVRPEEVPPGCEDKNRYSNVLPLPETRVPLKRIGNDPTSEYINANYVIGPGNIKNYYILCQAPLSNTVSDFWRMIWEQNSRVVVMLTEYMENGVEKCYEYLPPSEISDNKRIFGDFKVILKKREQRDKYAISSVQLINMATRTWREVTHLWYFWPAKGVPEDYDSVIDFLFEMRSYMKVAQTAKEYDEEGVEVIYGDRSSFNNLTKLKSDENGSGNGLNVYSPAKAEEQMRRSTNNNTLSRMKAASEVEGIRPCVVVCASGAGRSGALAALDVCARALAAGAVDVPRAVRALRTQRPHSLSNRQHYIFLYKVLSEYGNKIMGNGDTI